MLDDPKSVVDSVIDSAIRGFNPDEPDSFERWDKELQVVENLLRENSSPSEQILLATVQAQRIALAYEVGRFDLVLGRSSRFVLAHSASHPSFSNVAILRMHALHVTGSHEAEIQETIALARRPEIEGGEYVSLLENLGARHPDSLPCEEQFSVKLMEAVAMLKSMGYEIVLPSKEMSLAEAALRVASALRQANREKGHALLTESE